MTEELLVEDVSSRRPHTATGTNRRSVASSYLDLRPLPEDVMLESTAHSFDSKGTAATSDKSLKSWKDEEEQIRRIIQERLPSSRSLDSSIQPIRPSTAPQLGDKTRVDRRQGLVSSANSARSARYLAIQWRSRATQLSLAKTLHDSVSDSPPSPARTSDGSETDSDDSHSTESDVSVGTMDESIKSQVSDAQRVVEKWQARWTERSSESMSICSDADNASREDEDRGDKTTCYSAETLKARGSKPLEDSDIDFLPQSLGFAYRPTNPQRQLITTEDDAVKIESALKPKPLQRVESGAEFMSESLKNLRTFTQVSSEEYEEEETSIGSNGGVFIMNEGGKVMDTLIEDEAPTHNSQEFPTDYDESLAGTNSAEQTTVDIQDDHLSHSSSSSRGDGNDDEFSMASTVGQQSLHKVADESFAPDLSFDNSIISSKEKAKAASLVQTFCSVPEPLVQPKQEQNQPSTQSISTEQTPVESKQEVIIDKQPTPVEKKETPAPTSTKQEVTIKKQQTTVKKNKTLVEAKTKTAKTSSAPSTTTATTKAQSKTSKDRKFSGSVQERIEAVKRAKAAAEKKKAKKTSTKSKKSSRSRTSPRSSPTTTPTKTQEVKKTSENAKPIRWEEHNVVFTFGLLTTYKNAPPKGVYPSEEDKAVSYKDTLRYKSKLLHELMTNFGEIIRRTKALGDGSTKYMMCSPDCVPRPVSVKRDGKFHCKFSGHTVFILCRAATNYNLTQTFYSLFIVF